MAKENIARIISYDVRLNTRSESQALIRGAKVSGWKHIYITAPPFHQLRAFITAVSVALKEYPGLAIYNRVGKTMDWGEEIRHSQGESVGTRIGHIQKELKRIDYYHERGHLAPLDEVLKYLEKRDKINF